MSYWQLVSTALPCIPLSAPTSMNEVAAIASVRSERLYPNTDSSREKVVD